MTSTRPEIAEIEKRYSVETLTGNPIADAAEVCEYCQERNNTVDVEGYATDPDGDYGHKAFSTCWPCLVPTVEFEQLDARSPIVLVFA